MLATRVQKNSLASGRNIKVRWLDVWKRGIRKRIIIENSRARTPPSLLGIDRRMA